MNKERVLGGRYKINTLPWPSGTFRYEHTNWICEALSVSSGGMRSAIIRIEHKKKSFFVVPSLCLKDVQKREDIRRKNMRSLKTEHYQVPTFNAIRLLKGQSYVPIWKMYRRPSPCEGRGLPGCLSKVTRGVPKEILKSIWTTPAVPHKCTISYTRVDLLINLEPHPLPDQYKMA